MLKCFVDFFEDAEEWQSIYRQREAVFGKFIFLVYRKESFEKKYQGKRI